MRTILRVAGLVLPGPLTFLAVQLAGAWQTVLAIGLLTPAIVIGVIVVMAVGIHREERAESLGSAPPGPAAAFTRRLLNVHVRQSMPTDRPTMATEVTR
ncbi:hypothetical protein [Planobispora takensis]|uniref:Uncharacterized protein n=1 Tax=Planobispora takensis TaxID=1367882 RepID=A0A8J3WXP6_9ACTN|nr:hypothetical protein [Planobispora takensis]GII05470.1 hypothetical protein Pta02_74780 [Planobispora takensis]